MHKHKHVTKSELIKALLDGIEKFARHDPDCTLNANFADHKPHCSCGYGTWYMSSMKTLDRANKL